MYTFPSPLLLRICPRCRTHHQHPQVQCAWCGALLPLPEPPQRPPATAETCLLYRADDGDAWLLLSPTGIEYWTAPYSLYTIWSNIRGIAYHTVNPTLLLHPPGTMYTEYESDTLRFTEAQAYEIPLRPFGYDDESQLAHDMTCFCPNMPTLSYWDVQALVAQRRSER
jgi:hypothetical protein